MQDFLFEIIQSILVVIIGYIFGKVGKRTKTPEQIEAKAELKKQKYIKKQFKKNSLTPVSSEADIQKSSDTVKELVEQINSLGN